MVGHCASAASVAVFAFRFFSQSCWQYTFVFVHSSLAIRQTGGDGWTLFTWSEQNYFHYSQFENVRNPNNLQYLQWRSETSFPSAGMCFYVTAGSGSPLNLAAPPLSWAAKSQLYNQLLQRAVPSPQAPEFLDKKKTVYFIYFFLIFYFIYFCPNFACILDAKLCLDSFWLCLHVCVSDYVRKTHCAWKTNWSVGRDDTQGSCFFSF